jgi:hypothetical protein
MYGYGRSVLWFWLLLILRYDNMISYHHTVRITGYIILQLPRGSTGIFHDKLRYGTEQGDHISLSYVPGMIGAEYRVQNRALVPGLLS